MAGRILIVDPVPTNRMVLKAKLSLAHYDVSLTDSVQQARKLAGAHEFEVVLASSVLADHSANCVLKWIHATKTAKGTATTFILMRDRPDTSTACKLLGQCLTAGADDVLNRPFSESVLLARIRNLMRDNAINRDLHLSTIQHSLPLEEDCAQARTPPAKIAIAHVGAGEPAHQGTHLLGTLRKLTQNLGGAGTVEAVPLTALTQTDTAPSQPDVALLIAQSDASERALSITSQLRSRAQTQDLRVILALEAPQASQAARAFDLGAHDVVPLGSGLDDLTARIRNQAQVHRNISSRKRVVRESLLQAVTDPLTGLYNRRYATSRLAEMQRDCLASGNSFAILAFDVDHFKAVNDRYGHAVGDTVLMTLAQTLRENLREGDLICRTGGEEFLVALPHSNKARATATANRLRQIVGALDISVKNSPTPLRVTVSIGLSLQDGHTPIPDMLEQADRALYQAKAQGRNIVAMDAAA